MKVDPISIVDVIKKGDIGASLITTFNATFPYYEEFLLRRLASAGCRNNVLLADQRQLSIAYQSEATRPRRAGLDYTLVPIGIPGAFHPKLCLLAGKKRASLFVGSHNMTVSGFGYNREVTNHLEFVGKISDGEAAVFSQAWAVAREWIVSMSDRLPSQLIDSAFALDAAFGRSVQDSAALDDGALLVQSPGREGLLDQLARHISGKVKRITVLGAFFDTRAEFLAELLRRWPRAQIVVGIDPSTVWLTHIPSDPRLIVVDASVLADRTKQADGYLHAKAIFIEVTAGQDLFASGSANPSEPAWLSVRPDSNVEAILVRTGVAAEQCAKAIGLQALSTMNPVAVDQVGRVAERSKRMLGKHEFGPRVVVGIADYEQRAIIVRRNDFADSAKLVPLNELDTQVPSVDLARAAPEIIRVSGSLSDIRSLLVVDGGVTVARVLIHHPEVIARHVLGTSREPTIDLLRKLGSADADISRILPHIERLIFTQASADAVGLLDHRGRESGEFFFANKPTTFEITIAQMSTRRRPSLFAESSDVSTLIDILTNHIPIADSRQERGFDASGRSEEEQIGQDDEEQEPPPGEIEVVEMSDSDIADQVCRRVGKLCKKMIRALDEPVAEPRAGAILVIQLVAVLAVLQELDSVALADRWRRAHLVLIPSEAVESLFEAASSSLFSPGDTRLEMVSGGESVSFEELYHLHALMLWLAWWCGVSWTSPIERIDSTEAGIVAATDNGQLVRLLRLSHDDPSVWEATGRLIDQTVAPSPKGAASARRWIERHKEISARLSLLPVHGGVTGAGTTLPGDVVLVPQTMDEPTIAVDADGRYVSVIVGGKERRFLADRVIKLARI